MPWRRHHPRAHVQGTFRMREHIDPVVDGRPTPPPWLLKVCRPLLRVLVFGSLFVLLFAWLAAQRLKRRAFGD